MRLTNNPCRQAFALHAGALCRAILAFRPHREIDQILQARTLKRFTPNTPVTTTRVTPTSGTNVASELICEGPLTIQTTVNASLLLLCPLPAR